jgi:hypothetical protein
MGHHPPSPVRETPHPLTQALDLVRRWLAEGPQTQRQLDRLAARRGLSAGLLGRALQALQTRREVARTQQGRETTYRLATADSRTEERQA